MQRRAYQSWKREKDFGSWRGLREAPRELLYPPYDEPALTALGTASERASLMNDEEFIKTVFKIESANRTEPIEDFVAKRLFRQSYFDNAYKEIASRKTHTPLSEYAAALGPHGPAGGQQHHHHGGPAGGHYRHHHGGTEGGHYRQSHGGYEGGLYGHKSVDDGHRGHNNGHQGHEQYPYPYPRR